ncbi:TetR/AcrR family transcriptional regulator [Pseudoteredinibacter isoporae]|uniref:AcrR family transcriptional regulator n=1 Tax=Pseudoteredinibacter isoporae TaxID=570281 RepID=A0A7X0MU38_9GAMM|nr:TetR/AcrR family transcriptional regulator [Pseudoteredinibacter isoporae]MBB6520216.1 AcrR family transcriptional regulator [Pseudoteredinibacter isoporae]NHO85788.1 TetR/AcrR family transcriptional regulator [Pseudoteredinibacter isoporae]NIB25760.1 TetR/AcrR family transcriptional regulator [Pseudoteredinibacter isoporae]
METSSKKTEKNTDSKNTKASGKGTKYRQTKRLKAGERKQMILDEARNIILSEGFAQLSARSVAEKSGIRLATLQYYFSTKEELFRAVFEDVVRQERERIEQLRDDTPLKTPASNLKARVVGHLRADTHEETAGLFYQLWAMAYLDDYAKSIMDEFYERNLGVISELISAYNEDLSELECRSKAVMIIAFLEGLTLFVHGDRKNAPELENIEDKVVNMIFNMVNATEHQWVFDAD